MIASFFAEKMPKDGTIKALLSEKLWPRTIQDVTSYYRSGHVEVDVIVDEAEGITPEAIARVLKTIGFSLIRTMATDAS